MGRYIKYNKCIGCVYSNQEGISRNEETRFNCSRFYTDKWQNKNSKEKNLNYKGEVNEY